MRARLITPALVLLGCTASSQMEELRPAVEAYNDHLRWKRFTAAADFLLDDERTAFLSRYLAAEDDLSIHSVEIVNVAWAPKDGVPGANVTTMAQASLLPSTVVKKIVMTQRWELRHGSWLLVQSDRQLAPEPVEPEVEAEAEAEP